MKSNAAQITDEKLSQLRKIFRECDLDGSGRLEPAELSCRLQRLGLDASEETVSNLLKQMDLDGRKDL